jgi:hypothetical protein
VSSGLPLVDIAAPNTGDLSGVAIMQDKRLTGNKNVNDMTYAGNNLSLNIQGLIYMPNAVLTISGAISKHTGGYACVGIVAKDITVNGGGWIYPDPISECDMAGLTLPTITGTETRQALIQ